MLCRCKPALPVWLLWLCIAWCPPALAQQAPDQDLMSMSIEELARIKVYSASRHLENANEAPGSVSIVSAEEIKHYGWRTLGEILRSLPGFYTSYDRDYTYLGVRGFSRPGDYNSRMLLLIDGHRVNDNVYDSAPVGVEFPLDLDLIDHIEVIRGPGSSLYGTNAFFGVINVITRQPATGTSVEVSAEDSSFLSRNGRLTGTFKNDRISALLSGSLYRSAGADQLFFPEYDSPVTNNGIAQNMDGENFGHAFADVTIGGWRFEGLYSSRTKIIPTAAYGTNFDDPASRGTDTRAYVDASYHRDISNVTDLDIRAYYDFYGYRAVGAFGGTQPPDRYLAMMKADADWIGLEAQIGRKIGRQRITAGAEYEYSLKVNQTSFVENLPPVLNTTQTPTRVAGYAEAELKLRSNIAVNAGGRLDWFDSFGTAFSPRIALVYTPSSRTTLKYILGRAFRAPNAYESYYADFVRIGPPNPNLRPENITSHDLVLIHSFRPWLQFTAEGFYNRLGNLIDQVPDPSTGLQHFVNDGLNSGKGLDFELEMKRPSGLSGRLTYTLADAQDNSPASQNPPDYSLAQRLNNSPLNVVKLNATVPVSRPAFLGIELLYNGAETSYQGTRVPPWFLTNFTFSTKPLWGGWEFSASCYNAFNRTWYSPGTPDTLQPDIQQDGRTFRFKVTYRFSTEGKPGK
ncbi:MAG: TonB-dependent receptor [Candidatus Korobacteraceae bacterium]